MSTRAASKSSVDLDLYLCHNCRTLDVTREAVRLGPSDNAVKVSEPFTSAGQSLLWAWSDVFDWLTEEIQNDLLASHQSDRALERRLRARPHNGELDLSSIIESADISWPTFDGMS